MNIKDIDSSLTSISYYIDYIIDNDINSYFKTNEILITTQDYIKISFEHNIKIDGFGIITGNNYKFIATNAILTAYFMDNTSISCIIKTGYDCKS